MIEKNKIIEALKKCIDPELRLDVYTLGLIYDISVKDNVIDITMTLTSPMCPYGPIIMDEVKLKVSSVKNVKKVNINLVFEPLWQPTEEVKLMLGIE